MEEYANLDLLRALAVLAVFSGHLVLHTGLRNHGLVKLAHLGVVAFFVHTSLVLMFSLERLVADSERTLAARFYVRRAFRIYPLSIFAVLSVFLFEALHHQLHGAFWSRPVESLLSNLLLIQNLTHSGSLPAPLWSLPFEVQMYLVLPVLFILVRESRIFTLASAYVIGLLLASRFEVAQYVPCFYAGIIAYAMWGKTPPRFHEMWWPVIICSVGAAYWAFGQQGRADWIAASLLGLAVPFFRQICWRPGVITAKLVARYSYGIYLSHSLLISFIFGRHWSIGLKVAVLVILAVSVPVVAYHTLEIPMIRVGQTLEKNIRVNASRGVAEDL